MATQLEEDFIEDEQPLDLDEPPVEDEPDDAANDDDTPPNEEPDDAEVDVIGWGGGAVVEAEEESEGVRSLRKRLREIEKENRELKGVPKVEDIGPEPTLEDCDFDDEEFKRRLRSWDKANEAAQERETQAEAASRKQLELWEAQSRQIDEGLAAIRAPGRESVRADLEEFFPGVQSAYLTKAGLIGAGTNASAFLLALKGSPEKQEPLKKLAAEGSWAEFIATAAVMAKEINVQRRKPNTAPEQERRGGTGGAVGGVGGPDARLEKLERDAAKTGDRSALIAYKAKLNK